MLIVKNSRGGCVKEFLHSTLPCFVIYSRYFYEIEQRFFKINLFNLSKKLNLELRLVIYSIYNFLKL